MTKPHEIGLIDTHAGGDVSRIVFTGIKELPGESVREQMLYLQKHADDLRKTLLFEPYGIPEMSIDLIVPAKNKEAVAGYIIMEVMGYPIYSGSNTMCTATAVIENGLVEKKDGILNFKLEAPAGLVDIEAKVENGVVESITCEGLPSYIHKYKEKILIKELGEITYSIAYSGGFYILVEAKELGFNLSIDEEKKLSDTAYLIIEAVRKKESLKHYALGDVGPVPFLHYMGEVEKKDENFYTSRSATYVHPGVICRSTTGTGTSARLAFLEYENKIKPGDSLETVSLRETKFIGTFDSVENCEGYKVIKNRTTGKSYIIAKSQIIVNYDDCLTQYKGLTKIIKNL
ncbi:proline racemase family protein [Halarcobacter sp.]|uniref:proline racemase family protein n=1 Tax=Halarcobacter sp. TaxID=2321133 RepID=UPI002AAB5DF6|nr:proline racemase family protein [Halarcobacter sp.]